MDEWLKALSRAIYGPRGGGMFGNDLHSQIRREVLDDDMTMMMVVAVRISRITLWCNCKS